MPVVTQLISKKVKNSLRNGENFLSNPADLTNYLKANVLQKLQIEMIVDVGWYADITQDDLEVNLIRDLSDLKKGYFYIPSINWKNEGFSVGDNIKASFFGIIPPSTPGIITINAEITSIDGSYCYITDTVDLPDMSIYSVIDWGQIKGLTQLLDVDYGYGFIIDNGSFSLNNIHTGTTQRFFATDVSPVKTADPYDTINKAWITGDITIERTGDSQDRDLENPELTFSRYRIIQEVVIPSFYKDGELNNLKNLIPPLRFAGERTLRHVFETKFKDTVYNPNISKEFKNDETKSSVGWIGEASNGFKNNYSVTGLTYTVGVVNHDTLQVESTTRVNFILNDSEGNFSGTVYIEAGHIRILETSQYKNSSRTWLDLWMFDTKRQANTAPSVSSSIITNLITSIVTPGTMSIQYDVVFSADQKSRIENGENFFSFINVEDPALDADSSNSVCVPVDVNTYEIDTDISDLVELDKIKLYSTPVEFNPIVEGGFTDLKMWNESGFMVDFRFALNTLKDPKIQTINGVLVAYNPTTEDLFDIESYGFNLDITEVSGVEQVNIDTTRNYNLAESNQFNLVKLFNDGSTVGKEFYRGQLGVKTNWQNWLELPGANTIFLDNAKDFKGFNKRSSNYSLKEGYEIRFMLRLVLLAEGVDTTYNLSTTLLEVSDYGLEPASQNHWDSQEIKTFAQDNTNVEGSVLTDQNTKVKCIAVPNVAITDASLYWGTIRIEEQRQSGFDIDELSSIQLPPENNRLTPNPSETLAVLSVESGNLIIECEVDFSKLKPNANYSLSFEADKIEPDTITGAYSSAYNKTAYN